MYLNEIKGKKTSYKCNRRSYVRENEHTSCNSTGQSSHRPKTPPRLSTKGNTSHQCS
jgi:hypothetical protein